MCGCPLGQVWHGSECIDEDSCPTDCDSASTATSSASGDPHYNTFDGETHHFQGTCKYTFIESEDSSAVSCVHGFTFEFYGKDQHPSEVPRYSVTVDGAVMNLEDRQGGSYNSNFRNDDCILYERNGHRLTINTWFGVSISYSYSISSYWGYMASLSVTVPSCYVDQLTGLCGNYNEEQYDEFDQMHSLSNWRDHQLELSAWANDFSEDDPVCREVHDLECDDVEEVEDLCIALDETIPGGPFHDCPGDKTGFYLACLIDTCESRESLCPSLSSYARQCMNALPASQRADVCNWASELDCEEDCGVNMDYNACANVCDATRTCMNRHMSDADRCPAGVDALDSMCVCQPGYILDNGECIPEADCGCVWEHNGVYYPQGATFENSEERCECSSAGVICAPIPCVWHNDECIDEDECPRDCPSTGTGRCRAWGDPHYTTFDGGQHHFQGRCKYTFVESNGNNEFRNMPAFKIDVDQKQCGAVSSAVSCIDGWTFEFPGRNQGPDETPRYMIILDGTNMVLEDRLEGRSYRNWWNGNDDVLQFKFHCGYHHMVRTWFGVDIDFYYRSDDLRVTLPDCYRNRVTGLCGNWNGVAYDEFSRMQGIGDWRNHQTELVEWANDFAEPDPRCREVHDFECDDIDSVTDMCVPLDKNIPGGAFHQCPVDKDDFYLACLIDTCQDLSTLCSTFNAYATECINSIDSHLRPQICNWANELGCEEECGANMEYQGCANVCSATKTCMDRHLTDTERCGARINEIDSICVCQPGFIFDGDDCILEADCGCVWDFNNVYYPQGSSFNNNDERCECTSTGVVFWHNDECIDESECPQDCDINQTTKCKAWGDPHYTTFDGGHHHFQGACKYTFVESARNDDFRNSPAFKIDVDQRQCGHASSAVSCIRGWTFEFPGKDQGPDETPRYIITLESTSMVLEDRYEGNTYHNRWNGNDDVLEFKFHCGYHHIVRTWFGLRIDYYYGRADLQVSVPNCFMNHVTGLCGNWNGVSYDEFSRMQGLSNWRNHQTELVAWANDFAEPDPRCREVHDVECDDIDAVTDMCVPLDKNIPGGAFHECSVDKDDFYLACLVDTCQDPSALCSTFKAFATECLNNIAAHLRPQICSWANELGCEEECGENMNYEGCANVCSATKTCMDRHLTDAERCGATINDIDSLCVCQPGFIFDGTDCILEANCGCVWDYNNVYYSQGASFSNNDERCECTAAGIVCVHIPCDEKRWGHCRAHNDPYIRSFDGPQIGFHGDCRYNLARAEDTVEMPGFSVDSKNRRPWLPFTGAVTDEIWFDFHGSDYEFGDSYKYSLHVRNLDTSSRYWNNRFEMTLVDNQSGLNIYDAVEITDYVSFEGDGVTLYATSISGSRPRIDVQTRFVRVVFDYRSWSAYVSVSDCYRNKISGLCGNFNGNNAEELDNRIQYALDSDAFGDEFMTVNDGTCSHGERLAPCEDLSAEDYNEAANRCDALRQSPRNSANRNVFAGCEFLGDRTPTHEACFFNSCVQDDLHCGIMSDYATQCLERKDPLSADYARICNWAAATGCEDECRADQVFKGCGNTCHEEQTCEDHARGNSREDRCAGSTFSTIEAMCGCPEGHVLEGDTCVPESSCGCLTDSDVYVEFGSEILTDSEICTCGAEGELTCEALTCPCDVYSSCVDLVCAGPRDFVGGPEGIVGTFQVTRNYEFGYEFTCDYPDSDGGFSAGEHIGPHIFDGDMSRMKEIFKGVSTANEERMSRKMARVWWNAGNMCEKEGGLYTVDFLTNACVPGFNSIRITQEHNAETDAVTKQFFFNGVLRNTRSYASSRNMYIGELTAFLVFFGEEFGPPPGQIRNFYFRDTEIPLL
ncbi:unnamed protein product [Oikopleura dioica]|uniref:VWFD domain-containing protein n=1 Tax=Oikopleura dioica TaxID=34765 RepID=E4XQE0_OIKDI|nr:unnamed protein product [Oikopleura dioica]